MRLHLFKLQYNNREAKLLKDFADLSGDWEVINGVLQYQKLLYVPEISCSELISCQYDDFLAGYFSINKTRELIGWKYHWPSLKKNIETYIRGYDDCFTLKTVRHKLYGDLQSLHVSTH